MKSALILLAVVLASGTSRAADQPAGNGPRAACKAEVEKLCSGIEPGGGRIVACLRQNDAQLSAPCKEALAQARARKAPEAPASPQG
jgi:hypothetical protein